MRRNSKNREKEGNLHVTKNKMQIINRDKSKRDTFHATSGFDRDRW